MPLKVSKEGINKLRHRVESLANRAKGMRDKSEAMTGRVVQTAEVGLAAFGFGMVNGRWGGVEVLGVPADLGAGIALHLAGFAGLGGKNAMHLHNFADGALSAYLTTLGAGMGRKMAREAIAGGAASDPRIAAQQRALTALQNAERAAQQAGVRGDTMSAEELAAMAR